SVPDARITNVRIDGSNNGAGILAMAGARGSATLTNVTITDSADGHIVVQPGSQFVITGGNTGGASQQDSPRQDSRQDAAAAPVVAPSSRRGAV
ncbi:hypothetical protein ACL02R_17625, partial [Streptomyces sp. MS19]|uniref:hypothetical protein n=1 Tax=Streptomyces sp. MS19 TaxID=3385972 RepID=UPI00399FC26B